MFVGIYRLLLALVLVLPIFMYLDCPTSYAKTQEVTTNELQEIMESGQDFALINVLPKIIYDSMHLPGSINYPIGKLEELSVLPFPKKIPLVFYCMGHL